MEKGLLGMNEGVNRVINELDNVDIVDANDLDIDIRGGADISEAMRQAVSSVRERKEPRQARYRECKVQ